MATYNANTVREEVGGTSALCRGRGSGDPGSQEHRRVHTDQPINYRRVGGCTFITSSAWRNDAQAATGGVGLMVSPEHERPSVGCTRTPTGSLVPRSREGQLAGCSPEERVTSWFTHFRDLLGTHPTVDGAEEEIPAVLTNLEIVMAPSQLRVLPQ
ncbi:hypothetical protein AAFF_G00400130 [Aldrovandia affinis]|uniref:Uncharacterized protein n=1 Tax=Aldrovandia affinis TaxID=143900 RepID=A0AAD7R3W9_9TELE|nr:hypothetical protein AAFF_G00400130 [Aldrovandia affinis]